MKVVKLKPIQYPPTLAEELEKEIIRAVTREVYLELLKLLKLKPTIIQNAVTPADVDKLRVALREGTLTYDDGMFSGALDAGLTRALRDAGAKWDGRLGVFRLSEDELEPALRQLISDTRDEYKKKLRVVDQYLSKISPEEVTGRVALNRLFDNAIKRTEKDFKKNMAAITLTPELDDEQRSRLVARWETEARHSIKDLVEDQVTRLRARVAQSVEVGTRYSNLVKGIQAEYSVSQGRAKLIARQETKGLVNTYAKERYADAGVREYFWHNVAGTPAHPVRPRHKALGDASKKGMTYRFDDPPIVTEPSEAERRGNPGDDFNCRCWAQPVVKFGGR